MLVVDPRPLCIASAQGSRNEARKVGRSLTKTRLSVDLHSSSVNTLMRRLTALNIHQVAKFSAIPFCLLFICKRSSIFSETGEASEAPSLKGALHLTFSISPICWPTRVEACSRRKRGGSESAERSMLILTDSYSGK